MVCSQPLSKSLLCEEAHFLYQFYLVVLLLGGCCLLWVGSGRQAKGSLEHFRQLVEFLLCARFLDGDELILGVSQPVKLLQLVARDDCFPVFFL